MTYESLCLLARRKGWHVGLQVRPRVEGTPAVIAMLVYESRADLRAGKPLAAASMLKPRRSLNQAAVVLEGLLKLENLL